MHDKKTIEIPFGAKDSELYKFEYTIPEGYEAEIKDGKVIVKKKESEDEKIRMWLIRLISTAGFREIDNDPCPGRGKVLDWLEKQKEQKSAEWSEEDEVTLDAVLNALERVGDYGTIGMQKDWLKSLRPQLHLKPSEEQMQALELVLDYHAFASPKNRAAIKSLYEDLKKL